MQTIAFILIVFAIVSFVVEAVRSKSFIAWGLAAFAAAYTVQLVWETTNTITVN